MRTSRLKILVDDVLKSIPKPHGEDVIEDVFLAIENTPRWKKAYDDLENELGKTTTNAWGAFWIAHAEGRTGGDTVPASRTTLLESYSKLKKGAKKPSTKVKEPVALKSMSEYYMANRAKLPASIPGHRELIVALIMAGMPVEEAFVKALEDPAFAK